MKSIRIRGSLVAAVAGIFVLGYSISLPAHAQQTALVDNPEIAAKGVWNQNTTYAKEDIVTARGSAWISLRAGNKGKVPGQTSPSTARDWQLLARGFNPTGEWLSSATYQPDDLVTRLGQTWRAKRTLPAGTAPAAGANWELFAAKGAAGPNTGIPDGTSSAPGISFAGDANTGIYQPETGKIAMVENGALFLHNIGLANSALGVQALSSLTNGEGNTAVGHEALQLNTEGHHNAAFGRGALQQNTSGFGNVAMGTATLELNQTGGHNVALGLVALASNTTGSDNVAVGPFALANFPAPSSTIAIGAHAGQSANNPSNSIFIGNNGSTAPASATIKIGTQGTHTTAFIAGISGATVTGAGTAAVNINTTTGQLGIPTSSRRYKYDIETMADVSAMLARLRPVTFRYKEADSNGEHPLQYGLIAEEVAEVFPDLAVFNKDGQPETVQYHALPSFLLAGYQAQQQTIAAQADEIARLKERVTANGALDDRLRRLEALLPQTRAALR